MTLTVSSTTPTIPEPLSDGDNTSLTDNLEIRQEMIWLINQTRKANGISELPVNEALMNAAQVCSNRHTPGITLWRRARPLPMPAIPTASVTTSPCSPAQLTPPSTLSTIGLTRSDIVKDTNQSCQQSGKQSRFPVPCCRPRPWWPHGQGFFQSGC